MGKDVIVALDFPRELEVFNFLEKFGHKRPYVKIGMELYYAEGPRIVRLLKTEDIRFFSI